MLLPYFPLLAVLAPLLAGTITGLFGGRLGRNVHRIATAADVFAFALSVLTLYGVIAHAPLTIEVFPFSGLPTGLLRLDFRIDRLAAVMMVHITAISTLIHLFSIRYMQQERGYARFHSLLSFTTFALLGMVGSADILMLFVFWQLLSWLLSFLSYNYAHPPTVRGAFRTFIVQRFGDTAFLGGIVLAHIAYGSLDMQQLFARASGAEVVYALAPGGGLEINASTAVTLLIFVGAMSKSAQLPFHMWLPDSLYAPTPVTAFLHAGIVNAAGFLLARLAPLYDLSPATLHLVFIVGLLTALLGSSMMLTQNDIKKTLGYSTIGQMGFMIMECGLGAFGLAIFHLIAHGIFKGTIFLNCGNVIHAARHEPRLPEPHRAVADSEFSSVTWFAGFITTLILPLVILLAAHEVLHIPLRDSQGAVIFLFFGWMTSSQAILTLYRLRAVGSWKVAVTMLTALFLVVVTYLLAAESFTYFLFPAPGEVARHFQAGALPAPVFDSLVAAAALLIVLSWTLIYANAHGRSIRLPLWVHGLQVQLYLFLMNRLYLDAVAFALARHSERIGAYVNTDARFPYLAALIALVAAASVAGPAVNVSPTEIAALLVAGSMLPLFPLHGLYVAAVTGPPRILTLCFVIILPAVGFYLAAGLVSEGTPAFLAALRNFALFGALYGSVLALAQSRIIPLLAYASMSLYSVLWWHLAGIGSWTSSSVLYFTATTVVTAGLLLTAQRVNARYGESAAGIGGLAGPMPRFATLLALVVMAAAGLPPFGLFAGYVGMLLDLREVSWALVPVLLTWLGASFYFFRMLQRLLFGPTSPHLQYQDLRPAESLALVTVVLVLVVIGLWPYGLFGADAGVNGVLTWK